MLDEISMKVRRFQRKQDEFQVDLQDVRRGVVIVDFLMESCPPGTVPDPVMLAAILTQVFSNISSRKEFVVMLTEI